MMPTAFLSFFLSFFLSPPIRSVTPLEEWRDKRRGSCAVQIDDTYSSIDFAIVVLCVHINNDTQLSLYLVVSGQF